MSLALHVDVAGLAPVEAVLARLDHVRAEHLLEGLARLIREQTRERIIAGGPAPDGSAWNPNLEGRTPILHRSGALARSIDYAVSGSRAVVGSGLIYAAIHQHGGEIRPRNAAALAFRLGGRLVRAKRVVMPARPYVGLSADDRAELVATAVGYLRRMVA